MMLMGALVAWPVGAEIGLERAASAQLMEAAAATARGGSAESPPMRPDLAGAITSLAVHGQAVTIPIVGRLGSDVTADGFELLAEHRHALGKARVLLLDIDSDAGSDAEALRIAAALELIRESVPVVALVRRAIGPAALILPVADRVLIPEPAKSGTIIAFQPESNRDSGMDAATVVKNFSDALMPLVQRSPHRDAWESLVADPSRWQITSAHAYGQRIAEPLDGGVTALGRALKIDPWIASGRQVEDLIRRGSLYAQQLQLYRAKLTARAFASLAQANEVIGAVAVAEQSASSLDPHRRDVAFPPRLESVKGRWNYTASSVSAWNKACEQAASAWERVAILCEDAMRHLREASNEIGALLNSAGIPPADPGLPDAIDRLERERGDLEQRIERLQKRRDAARIEAKSILELRRR